MSDEKMEMMNEEAECYGLADEWLGHTPPRPHLRHPPHDLVRYPLVDGGQTLIGCLYCTRHIWVDTPEVEKLPLMTDEVYENRRHKCGDVHWVRKEE